MLDVWFRLYGSYPTEYSCAKKCINDFITAVEGKKVYLYGAGTVARNIVNVFERLDIKVSGLFDKRYHVDDFKFSMSVQSPDLLTQMVDKESILIVAINNYTFDSVVKELSERGIVCNFYRGEDLHSNLRASLCLCDSFEGRRLDLRTCYECTILDNTCNSLQTYLKRIKGCTETSPNLSKMNMIGYTLGTICSLRCKHCCEAVPYLPKESRYFIDHKVVVNDITKLASACNFITLVEFIGGEPFLSPKLDHVLSDILKIQNVGMIHIFTNGTVVPSDSLCNAMLNERITVYVSNYQAILPENLQSKIHSTMDKLASMGVSYFRGKKFDWKDFSSFNMVANCSPDHLSHRFSQCFLSHCHRLSEGKLYHCPHQYAGVKLGKISDSDVLSVHKYSTQELVEMLNRFEERPYIAACKYCTMPFDAMSVPSGEQLG